MLRGYAESKAKECIAFHTQHFRNLPHEHSLKYIKIKELVVALAPTNSFFCRLTNYQRQGLRFYHSMCLLNFEAVVIGLLDKDSSK